MTRFFPLFLALFFGCAATPIAPASSPLIGEAWLSERARAASISLDDARARDSALPIDEPPEDLEDDPMLSPNAAALWRDLCATCHGLDGDPSNASVKNDPPPRTWGTFGAGMGFFFGGDKMRAGIFRKIAEGVRDEKGAQRMPGWSSVLAREQIWGLVFHIERL